MRVTLFDFQEDALDDLRTKLNFARASASIENPQVISFCAPTGAGKTIVMTALFEDIFAGEPDFESQPNAVVLWISDIPDLNEQSRLKIESKSDRIRVNQLITIDTRFDEELLTGGQIYFINTQKLGTEKLLTRRGDGRQYTIWETLTNTAKAIPDRFYVVIDEAHRGMRTGRRAQEAQTIMQRFLLGSEPDGLCQMPMVLGISATPRRFEDLLAGTTHTTQKVYVTSEDVRESGLLKDRILIHYPETSGQVEMTLLAEAAAKWQAMDKAWKDYCHDQDEERVSPILVIQVEDGTASALTRTDVESAIATVESTIGRSLREGEVAHAFHDSSDIDVGGRRVRYVEPSRIEEDHNIGVVLFKMSLSTGWDCPRAEAMMSFRRAQDHTYIAQLLGRMVRTPLARRIDSDAELNDVHLFLPHYDKDTVTSVIEDLQNVEDVPPSLTGGARELVTLQRRNGAEDIFEAMQNLVTYQVSTVRKQSNLRRLMGLARGLTQDRIDEDAQASTSKAIVSEIRDEIERIRSTGDFDSAAKDITGVDMSAIAVQHGTGVAEQAGAYSLDAALADIDRYFTRAGRILGNGLEMAYWKSQEDREPDEVKVEVIVLAQNQRAMENLEQYAKVEFDELYECHRHIVAGLRDKRRQHYNKLRGAAQDPEDIQWTLPESIDFTRSTDALQFDKHLFLEPDGRFRADLGTWEKEVLEEELADESVVGWLRNVDRKPWALQIPYERATTPKPMYPDLIIVRKIDGGFEFDILEPHNPRLDDNADKAVGLAKFAGRHGHLFRRIELIRKQEVGPAVGYIRLDIGQDSISREVRNVRDNAQLDALFDRLASSRS